MDNKLILGIGGQAGSGKDTVGNIIKALRPHAVKDHFAFSLKEGIGRQVFGFTTEQLYGHLKEVVDPFWDARLNLYSHACACLTRTSLKPIEGCPFCKTVTSGTRIAITPRAILQLAGTEAGREIFGSNLWTTTVERRVVSLDTNLVVICDTRFRSEVDFIHQIGGVAVKVVRPGAGVQQGVAQHASEQDPGGWDYVLTNDSDLATLTVKVDELLTMLESNRGLSRCA